MNEARYWIGVASQDHVEAALAHGFVQVGHGKAGPLERMHPGDGFVYYSPRAAYPDGAPLQAFTAIGRIAEGAIYALDLQPGTPTRATGVTAGNAPQAGAAGTPTFRRNASFLDALPAPIRPLLERLSFIRSRTHWGAAFRYGLVRIPREDFATIAAAMGRDADADFA
jgi:hypothetical protein